MADKKFICGYCGGERWTGGDGTGMIRCGCGEWMHPEPSAFSLREDGNGFPFIPVEVLERRRLRTESGEPQPSLEDDLQLFTMEAEREAHEHGNDDDQT